MRSREEEVRQEFRHLAFRMMAIAEELEDSRSDEQTLPERRTRHSSRAQQQKYSPSLLAGFASQIYKSRRERDRHLPPSLFNDPAWDMLLELFISKVQQKRIAITSLTAMAACPATTALRHIGVLEEAEFVLRENSEIDRRVSYISLTDRGYWSMFRTLEAQFRIMRGDERPTPRGEDHPRDSGDYLIEETKRRRLRAVK